MTDRSYLFERNISFLGRAKNYVRQEIKGKNH